MKRALIALAAMASLMACAPAEEPADAPAEQEETESAASEPEKADKPDRADVPWSDYAASVKRQIDAAERKKDCGRLQEAFDAADAGNDATETRTGHNNADLMSYIDEAMRAADCY